jgi:hypothetical protein
MPDEFDLSPRKAAFGRSMSVRRTRRRRNAIGVEPKVKVGTEMWRKARAGKIKDARRRMKSGAMAKTKIPRTGRKSTAPSVKKNPKKKTNVKYEHLRVRNPSTFTKFMTMAPGMVKKSNPTDYAYAMKKLGLRTLPAGSKFTMGKFKDGYKSSRPKGKKGNYLAWGVQNVMVPVKGGRSAKIKKGSSIPTKKAVKKAVKRAKATPKRKNPVGSKTATVNYKKYHVRSPKSFSSFRVVPPTHANEFDLLAMKKRAKIRTLKAGTKVTMGKFKATVKRGRPKGKTGKPLAWGIVNIMVPKPATKRKTTKKATKKVTKKKTSKRKTTARRTNPGSLMILNPMPKFIQNFVKKLSPKERSEFMKTLQKFVKFHGTYPTKITKVGETQGKQAKFLSGMGNAVDVSYAANGKKGYKKSAKRGTPWRHTFEGKPVIATDHTGKTIVVLNTPGSKKNFKVTDYIYG